jgi:hypothetical protein
MNKANVEKTKLRAIIYIGDGNLQTKASKAELLSSRVHQQKCRGGDVIERRQ